MRRSLVAVLLVALSVVGPPTRPAGAQAELGCAPDPGIDARIEQAPTVFTGTVRAVGNQGRTATVDVIRVWKGGTLPRRVQVTGTIATQSKVVTALDRLYARDRAYLFLPTAGSSPRFAENRCSATRALTAELSARAPADGGAPPVGQGVPLPQAGLGRYVPIMVVAPALVILAGLLVVARRKTVGLRRPVPRPGT